jgi:hypothetical protein
VSLKYTIVSLIFVALLGSNSLFGQSNPDNKLRILSQEEQEKSVKFKTSVYPNPVVDYLNIEILEGLATEQISIKIHSLIGTEIKTTLEKTEDGKYRVSLKDLNPGYYLVSIRDDASRQAESVRILKR